MRRRLVSLDKTVSEAREKGRLADAIAPAREVLAIRLKALGEDDQAVENSYKSLASTFEALGRVAEAEPLRREALKIQLKRVRNDDVATIACYLDAIALQHRRGNFAAARWLTQIALTKCRTIERPDRLESAQVLSRLAVRLENEGLMTDAELPFRQVLAIYQRVLLPNDVRIAIASYDLARCLHRQKKENEAERFCRAALVIGERQLGEVNSKTGNYRELLASCLKAQGKEAEAEAESKRAIAARKAEPSLPAKEDGVRILRINRPLGGIARAGKDAVAGSSKADGQGRRWIEVTEFSPPSTKQPAATNGRVLHLERIQAQLPDDAALIAWVQQAESEGTLKPTHEHWACVVRRSGEPVWVRILSSVHAGDRTAENDDALDRFRDMLSQRPDSQPGRWRDVARALARQWLGPLEPHLASRGDLPAVTHLIVLPSLALSGVPIEALADAPADKRPRYIVSYAPSARIFAWIRGRPRESAGSSRAPRLLALGDPLFTATDDVPPSGSSSSPATRASQVPTPRETPRQLPGTRREVLAIARLFDRPDTLFGSDASEQRLDALASSGRLREFDFIHLATHGTLDGGNTQRSALLLARDQLSDPLEQIRNGKVVYDGELSAEQVFYTWDLDAELVTLSACWSGLGHVSGRAGPLGFSAALIQAGARSVVMSLWNVDDAATNLLMTRFYQNLLGQRVGLERSLPKAEALAEAKQWLRSLEREQRATAMRQPAGRGSARQGRRASSCRREGGPSLRASLLLGGFHLEWRP